MSDTHTIDQKTANPSIVNSNTIIRRSKGIVFQQFDDELLAVDAEASVCFSLNESAGRIWALIENPSSFGTLCTQLCAEYEVDEETCLREVSAVLQQLSEAGLVRTGA